ncbi:MAG: glutamine synthetase III [Microthrixaceae bacterium]|nr:glutamine synthetase III [Microthrixaceae bacterium]
MHPSSPRQNAIDAVTNYQGPVAALDGIEAPDVIFGSNVFNNATMKARLPQDVWEALQATIERSATLDRSVADAVAVAMKDWAIERGATHYAHVFYPLTGLTAEKHDSFLGVDGEGNAIIEFSGKALIQGEPDASSFPNGGLRETFEARGYTGWDVTSPSYIIENPSGNTLCIPTVFVSYTGDALDKKTPLLRSQQVLDTQARRVLALFGHDNPDHVTTFVGAEQEYFLIDRHFFLARPDLISSGRTLFGARPPKGQEFEDHYFGAIPERVLAFMYETERELWKLGIPAKTRHNEVAPGQFEIAPVFERANLANDHQQLLMATLRRVAAKHGMECMLHEKPFEGVNGSGKHVNFSFGNGVQGNLLNPGDTPHENAQFLVFCAAVIRAVGRHAGLLRSVVASAANDHRLGANEAPPAIISVFLGEQLMDVFDQIAKGGATESMGKGTLKIGVDTLPTLHSDPGDRNRTSPLAFTGNRFEFRAPGSSQSIAGPMVAINTAVAESLDYIATEIAAMLDSGTGLNDAVQNVLQAIVMDHGNVIFNGDSYSPEWKVEAESRGLPNLLTTPEALAEMDSPSSRELFAHYGVLSHRELHSRFEVYMHRYSLSITVEARSTLEIARTLLLPAATRYLGELASIATDLLKLGRRSDSPTLDLVANAVDDLSSAASDLAQLLETDSLDASIESARFCCQSLIPAMNAVRAAADLLEDNVADDLWPLPTYQEMLFIL